MKSEPGVYSIDDLRRDGTTGWGGVRNLKARNYLRDEIALGDQVLFYHSNASPSGVAGLAEVVKAGHPDPTQFDRASEYHDPKASPAAPIWYQVTLRFLEVFPHFVSLAELKSARSLSGIMVTRRGARLSVQPVSPGHFAVICRMGREG